MVEVQMWQIQAAVLLSIFCVSLQIWTISLDFRPISGAHRCSFPDPAIISKASLMTEF